MTVNQWFFTLILDITLSINSFGPSSYGKGEKIIFDIKSSDASLTLIEGSAAFINILAFKAFYKYKKING